MMTSPLSLRPSCSVPASRFRTSVPSLPQMVKLFKGPGEAPAQHEGIDLCAAMRLAPTAQGLNAQANGSPPGGARKKVQVRQSFFSSPHVAH